MRGTEKGEEGNEAERARERGGRERRKREGREEEVRQGEKGE